MMVRENFKVISIATFLMCLSVTATGWYARNYNPVGFTVRGFSKIVAMLSLIFGLLTSILVPILFASSFGFDDSWKAIINLLILFLPVVVSALAVLFSKRLNKVTIDPMQS